MKQSCITIKLPLFLAMAVSMAAPVIADDGTTESIGDNNVMDTARTPTRSLFWSMVHA